MTSLNTTLSEIEELSLTPNDSPCTSIVKQGDSPADLLDHCNNINQTPEFSDSNANTDELVDEKILIKDPNEIDSSNSSTVDVEYVCRENETYKDIKTIENKPIPRRKGLARNDPSQGSIVTML